MSFLVLTENKCSDMIVLSEADMRIKQGTLIKNKLKRKEN